MQRSQSVSARFIASLAAVSLIALSAGVATTVASASAAASTPTNHPPASGYGLTDLTSFTPAGYNTPVPIAINSAGVVVGEIFSGAKPFASASQNLSGLAITNLRRLVAGTSAVPHVFVFANDRMTVVPTVAGTKQAWVTGLNDSGSFPVARCDAQGCNHYFVVRPSLVNGQMHFKWTVLQFANLGVGGLGPIAGNGDVTGAVANPVFAVVVVWRLRHDGAYSLPVMLGRDPHAGRLARAYIPLSISTATGHDLVGGIENTPAFYPDGSPALWGPKFAHDFAWIGSETIAMTGDGKTTLATVGCPIPVPACAPSCPIDARIDTVTVEKGLPTVSASLILQNPPDSVPHCGVSPLGVTVDPKSRPFTVGLMGIVKGHEYLPEAIVWEGRALKTLNDLVVLPNGSNLQWAVGVNNAGQIIGTGTIDGVKESSYLLTPTGAW